MIIKKVVIITGVTRQDGAYLAEYLLGLNYKVVGCYRRAIRTNFWRLAELIIINHNDLELVEHDLTDLSSSI